MGLTFCHYLNASQWRSPASQLGARGVLLILGNNDPFAKKCVLTVHSKKDERIPPADDTLPMIH